MPFPFWFVEVVAVVFSLAAVWLTIRKRILCWPVGLVAVSAYALFFLDLRLYADMGLQAVFFIQGLYGWWYWSRGGFEATEPPVRQIGRLRFGAVVAALLLSAGLLGGILARTDAALPYLDAFLAMTSLVANQLLARKILESWWLWITADVLYVGLFLYKGVPLSAALYAVFLFLAIQGAVRWSREHADAAPSPAVPEAA